MKIVSFLVLFFILSLSDSFTGKVVRVLDGDTIEVLTDKKERIRIRLEGIDCPESGQPFSNKATKLTKELVAGKTVTVVKSGEDRYGRILGFVFVGDVNVNKELLKNGLAWHYKYFNKDEELARLETQARLKKIGIWSETNPLAPWDFRRKYNNR
jgi:endonuclease YncB( thermonuclease family)